MKADIVQGTGTIRFVGLKPGGSVLGPGNVATTADASDGHYEVTLPAGSYEIVSVTDRSFVNRMPLTVDAGNCGSVIVAKDAQALIIREGSRARRLDGVISVLTKADVTCDVGTVYLPVTGHWLAFVPPAKYRVTTVLKDGSFSKTTSDVKPSPFLGLLRKADNVAEVRIARVLQPAPATTSDDEPRSPFFAAFTELIMAPEKRSEGWKLMTPYRADKPVTKRVTDDSGRSYLEWEVKSTIQGTSNSLRNYLPEFLDHISEVANTNGARITKTTPTDGEYRSVATMAIEFETAATHGSIQMQMTGFEDKDRHGHQMLTCGLHIKLQELAD